MCATFIPGIETPRLRLRGLRPEDAVGLATLANDFEVARMVATLPHPYGLEEADAFIAAKTLPGAEPVFAIEHLSFGLIGLMGFQRGDEPYREVGYWLGRTYWGRGFATEALTGALAWARDVGGARAIVSAHFDDNPQSGRVLTKAGFLYTGVVKPRRSAARAAEARSRMMIWLA
jgi:RimJ/RimL family protein N-acetyltransferase